tara:strand:+ start:553 stop:2637 length:2085 start_codon:yes stop_codon:yes gene_type:complete
MNVLQRKMFANGDVVNSPLVDVTAQIANLSLSGLAPIEIFELLQADYASKGLQMPSNLGMATIESIANQVGGKAKIDPTFIGPKRPLDPSRIDEIGIAPFNVSPDIAPDRLPPADPSLDPRLGTYAQQGDTLNPAATPNVVDFSEDLQGLMDTDITVEGDEQPEKKLGPNEIRLSDGRVIDFSQGIKDIQEGKGQGAFIYRIFNSPDIETGENVDKALKQFINVDEPGAIRFFGELGGGTLEERRGTAFGPEDIGSGLIAGAKGLFDFGREGLATILPGAISPFVGRETVENVREFFDADFPEGYAARGGFSPETIDNIVLSAAGIKEDKIAKDLEEIGLTENKQTPIKPEVEVFAEDEQGDDGEAESVADSAVAGKQPGVGDQTEPGDQTDAGAGLPGAVDEDVPPPPKSKEVSFAEFTTSPDFLRFVRNIGKGLVTQGELGKGIALGAAAAAEERAQEEALKAERDAELLKEMIEKGQVDPLKPSELKSLNAMTTELSDNIKNYEGTQASIGIMNDAISLFEAALQNDVPITGLPGRIARFKDEAAAFMGVPNPSVSDATRIKNYIEQVKQRSIREILNESGRTISNLDRDIVDRVFGDLDLTGDPKEILKKLKNARSSLIKNNTDKQRAISSTYEIVQNPAYQGVGVRAITPYSSLIEKIINTKISDTSKIDMSQIIDIDLRDSDLFNLGN